MSIVYDILSAILRSIFIGFGVVMPILALIRTSNLKTLEFKDLFMLTAVQAVRIAGIFYFIFFGIHWYQSFTTGLTPHPGSPFKFDSYFWLNWYTPIMYLFLSQLFWIKKLYFKKAALVTFAVLLLILPLRGIFTLMTAGTYFSGVSMSVKDMIVEMALNIIIFIFIIIPIIVAGGKLKKNF